MALGSTQLLVNMSTRHIPGAKDGRCVRLTTTLPSRAECHGIWDPKTPGTLWATTGLLGTTLSLYHILHVSRVRDELGQHIFRVLLRGSFI
jgi:hypothetical protein